MNIIGNKAHEFPHKSSRAHVQVCRVGLGTQRRIILSRHGESQYNTTGQLGGDSSLSELGQLYARLLPAKVLERLEAM